jgi:DNA repair photolyase
MPREIESKTILNKTKRRDPWFLDDYTVNPYSACSFNCLYCYIRGSKYGEHMEKALSVKVNAVDLLRKQLRPKAEKGNFGIIVLSSATDPYLKAEKEYQLSRQLLEVILEFRFPVHIITKSDLVTRDLDLLKEINKHAILPDDLQDKLSGGTIVSFSFSTLQDEVSKIFEPGATPPSIRLQTLEAVKDSGLKTGVSLMPLIPYISDTTEQLDLAFSTFKEIGVDYVLPATITLYGEGKADSKQLMIKAIKKHYPELEEKYHRFFDHSNQMPEYYKKAFRKKMEELHKEYGLSNSILNNSNNT